MPARMPPAITARNLTKTYGDAVAVDGVSFEVREGECFGFLGPNGAGKTTTMKMIYGFSPVTSGTLEVLGLDIRTHARDVKALAGICPQEDNLDPDFTVRRISSSTAAISVSLPTRPPAAPTSCSTSSPFARSGTRPSWRFRAA